jgi:sulfite oxidase
MFGRWRRVTGVSAAAAVAAGAACVLREQARMEAAGEKVENHFFTRAEIATHKTREKRVWVTYKEGVYDITDFIDNHPGGKAKIMLAAGSAIDPFWRVYQQHLNSNLPQELLATMKVGVLDPSEKPTEVDMSDPYSHDPSRHPGLKFHNTKPCNAELPPALQMQNWVTPNELFFIRHHHPVPEINAAEYRLLIKGKGVKPICLSLADLRDRFPRTEVTATLQCGGNRRAGLNKVEKTSGIEWGTGAISTATWGGVLLRDVLLYSGLLSPEIAKEQGVEHICFTGQDGLMASIPMEKALGTFGDVLLAYEMNGEPLPREHGYPLRAVVPGHVGVRNVKWVTEIVASEEEATGPWQRGIAYKGFSPQVKAFDGVDVEAIHSMQEMPVQSVIVSPEPGESIDREEGTVTVSGWAWSGGGRGIVRVDVSGDNGKTWLPTEITHGGGQNMHQAWAWSFWEAEVPLALATAAADGSGKHAVHLCCRAIDSAYNVQPETPESIWNIRGLNNTSWDRVDIDVKGQR